MKDNSKLLISGNWFNTKGILEGRITDICYLKGIRDIKTPKNLAFVIIPYQIVNETLGVHVKEEPWASIIYVEIEEVLPYNLSKKDCFIKFKSILDDRNSFIKKVNHIKEEIEKGTIYQINLTTRIEFEIKGDIKTLFQSYIERQPVPYGFLLETEDISVMSGSMELFLKKSGEKILSSPIKGTAKEIKFLEESIKDKAENLMITDIMRNDLGSIAIKGSVNVIELFKIVRYKTLYQMHSTIEALTEKDINEILKATFPPASVTGAPKKKAVEIIDILEDFPRGYYCGCAGILKNNGDFTLSVLIRTAVSRKNILYYYAGCGIVWDSVPEKEFEELILKTRALYELSADP